MKHSKELETVARAIYEAENTGKWSWDQICELATDPNKIVAMGTYTRCFRIARAALTAIREPTEGMIAANNFTGRHGFTAAIDYALRDTTGEGRSSSVSRPR